MPLFGKNLSQIAPAPEVPAAQVAAQVAAPEVPAAQVAAQAEPAAPAAPEAPAEPKPFFVQHKDSDGGYMYRDVTLDTRKIGRFNDYQITLIRCCEDLVHILKTYNIQNISLTLRTISGDYVYNNLQILADPAVNAEIQKWKLTWSAPPISNTRMLSFHREMLRHPPVQLQESGGNKRRKNQEKKARKN